MFYLVLNSIISHFNHSPELLHICLRARETSCGANDFIPYFQASVQSFAATMGDSVVVCVTVKVAGRDLNVMYRKMSVKSGTVMDMENASVGNVCAERATPDCFVIHVRSLSFNYELNK